MGEEAGIAGGETGYAQYPQYQPSSYPQYPTSPSQTNSSYPAMTPSARRHARASSLAKGTAELFKKKWPRAFFIVAIVQAIICIAFEGYTFAEFQFNVDDEKVQTTAVENNQSLQSQLKTIPTFLSLFIFGFLYELILVWDALRMKNTIQVIGLCIANLALMVYTAIQVSQVQEAVQILSSYVSPSTGDVDSLIASDVWYNIQPFLIVIPGVIGLSTLLLSFLAWKLYQEFAWDILKHIGADYRMKKRFLHYQIYIALLKFDFFFFVGFTIQFLVVVGGKKEGEFGLTCAAIPVTICILLSAAWFTRNEWKLGMVGVMILYLGGLAYFIFKLSRIYDPTHKVYYMAVRKSMTAFAVITIILIVLTIINAMVCVMNFGAGLKQHLIENPRREVDKDQVSYSLNDVKQTSMPSRMTID